MSNFKEVSSLDADVTIAIGKVDKKTKKAYPKQAEGFYLGKRMVNGTRGESQLHFLQTPEGNLGVWGTTDLNRKLGQVPLRTMVRITSTGSKATPKGDMFTYKVETDSTNTIEVDTLSAGSNTVNEGTDYAEEVDADDNAGDDAQAAALAAAEARKAAVLARLNGNKNAKR